MQGLGSRTTGDPAVGDRVGPYRLGDVLGEGASGIVFNAFHEPDGQAVALKVLKRQLTRNRNALRRFQREASIAKRIEHPSLVRILEVGQRDGVHFLASIFVPGGSIEQRLSKRGPLPIHEAVQITCDVASALAALHRERIVHRDVKPANILLPAPGPAVLADLGLATGTDYTAITKAGAAVGSVHYLAPEVVAGADHSAASDLYSLGCVLWACLAGRPPFVASTEVEVAVAHLRQPPPDLGRVRADVSPSLAAAILRALAKDPAERPPTAEAYTASLVSALDAREVTPSSS